MGSEGMPLTREAVDRFVTEELWRCRPRRIRTSQVYYGGELAGDSREKTEALIRSATHQLTLRLLRKCRLLPIHGMLVVGPLKCRAHDMYRIELIAEV